MHMRTFILVGAMTLSAALVAFADEPRVQIKFAPEIGHKLRHQVDLSMNLSGVDADVSAAIASEVQKIDEKHLETVARWDDLRIVAGGNEMEAPSLPMRVITTRSGELVNVTGGIGGTDPIRTYLTVFFPIPPKPLAKGEIWEASWQKTDYGVPALSWSVTYLGPEQAAGKDAHKFSVKMREQGGGMTTDSLFWVTEQGSVLKIDGKFSDLPIPIAGEPASGTIMAVVR
jgi:hypothetical protein